MQATFNRGEDNVLSKTSDGQYMQNDFKVHEECHIQKSTSIITLQNL